MGQDSAGGNSGGLSGKADLPSQLAGTYDKRHEFEEPYKGKLLNSKFHQLIGQKSATDVAAYSSSRFSTNIEARSSSVRRVPKKISIQLTIFNSPVRLHW